MALPVTASSAETGSDYIVKDAWDAFTYVYNPPLHLVVVSLDPICNVGIETRRTNAQMVRTGRRGTDPASLLEMAGLAVADVVKVLSCGTRHGAPR